MGVTRLWFFTLQPAVSATDPAFTGLWADVLELCAAYSPSPSPSGSRFRLSLFSKPSPPKRSHHFLFRALQQQEEEEEEEEEQEDSGDHDNGGGKEPIFVLISTYPSLALCSQADAVYTRRYRSQMSQYVRHRALRQMDLEDAEVMAALLASPPPREEEEVEEPQPLPDTEEGDGAGRAPPGLTLTISSRDPLLTEVKESLSSPGRGPPVPPPTEEISGADTYHVPAAPPPPPPPVDGEAGGADLFEAQRQEGRKWIRISRRAGAGSEDGDVEVFRLRELLSR